jgi:hypothetical protein
MGPVGKGGRLLSPSLHFGNVPPTCGPYSLNAQVQSHILGMCPTPPAALLHCVHQMIIISFCREPKDRKITRQYE